MSLAYQFPHCSLVAANSSSDTKTMNTHARRTRGWFDLGRTRQTESGRTTSKHVLQAVSSLWRPVSPQFSWSTEQKLNAPFLLFCSSALTHIRTTSVIPASNSFPKRCSHPQGRVKRRENAHRRRKRLQRNTAATKPFLPAVVILKALHLL